MKFVRRLLYRFKPPQPEKIRAECFRYWWMEALPVAQQMKADEGVANDDAAMRAYQMTLFHIIEKYGLSADEASQYVAAAMKKPEA